MTEALLSKVVGDAALFNKFQISFQRRFIATLLLTDIAQPDFKTVTEQLSTP